MFYIMVRGRNCADYLPVCLDSLIKYQRLPWRAVVILDNPRDNAQRVLTSIPYSSCDNIKYHVHRKHMGLGYNIWFSMEFLAKCWDVKDNDIICWLDADDWLAANALSVVWKCYKAHSKCLVTYGSYIKYSKGRKTKVSKPYGEHVNVRWVGWHGSHFKTFRYKIWRHFPKEYLQHEGEFVPASSDQALMFGIMELAGLDRCYHIAEPIYTYRDNYRETTPRGMQKEWEWILRNKKPLQKVEVL